MGELMSSRKWRDDETVHELTPICSALGLEFIVCVWALSTFIAAAAFDSGSPPPPWAQKSGLCFHPMTNILALKS